MEAVEAAQGGMTLSGVVDLARLLVGGRRASLMLPDDGQDELRVVAASGLAAEARAAHVRVGDPISGLVAQRSQPLLVNRLVPQTVERATRYATGSFISVPVPIGETQVGVLNVADPEGGPFRVDDLSALQTLAAQVGSGVTLSLAQQRLRQLEALNLGLRRQVIDAVEEERARIARELHDEAGHAITAAIFRLDLATSRLPGEATYSRALIEAVRASLLGYAGSLHALAFALRPRILQDLGLAAALRSLVAQAQEGGALAASAHVEGDPTGLPAELELLAFRVAQEGLTNVCKHARAGHAAVTLRCGSRQVEVAVEDDGIGLAASAPAAAAARPSLGLAGLRERVEVVGGTLTLETGTGGGTRLTARFPRRAPGAADGRG